jgi:putative signal transducing protein
LRTQATLANGQQVAKSFRYPLTDPRRCDILRYGSRKEESSAMTVTRQGLLEHFRLLNDDELRAQFHSGELTPLASGLAAEELQRRNLDLSRPAVALADKSQDPSISGDLVSVLRYRTAAEAYLLKNRLELEGIPTFVTDDLMFQAITGGVASILVPEAHLERAREIAAAIERGDYALDDQTDVG